MRPKPNLIQEYHVFLASPGDMNAERKAVRQFFDEYNRTTARRLGIQFTVIDWENYATAGVGRPQELITSETLEKYQNSLALVVGLMGQRFGSPTGDYESGTEEEFDWAIKSYLKSGFPQIKWFFRKIEKFEVQSQDIPTIQEALKQWEKVQTFKKRFQEENAKSGKPPLFYKEFTDINDFKDVLREDLSLWLNSEDREWAGFERHPNIELESEDDKLINYYENIVNDFQWLDIAGIDTDRAFRIPLSEMYVRLRVIFDEDSTEKGVEELQDIGPIDIRTALEKFHRLVIVGDPGSGKSTFLKFISLMIARAELDDNHNLATESLSIEPPFPIPIFISLWNLAEFLPKQDREKASCHSIVDYIVHHFGTMECTTNAKKIEHALKNGSYCLLFDGLDEVPTEQGRALISRLVEEFVDKYRQNRYVITSRIRAYTGDTILRGEFVRCDIQEFSQEDREEFLKNWFALLFRIPREEVTVPGSDSQKEHDSLVKAIERSERIAELAVNPLLLTVVAIVHWNRKRLPEQRVELYDECVDVLLGQRKEAERVKSNKKVELLSEAREDKVSDDRTWTRKRFSEIALQILLSEDEDITKAKVIELLEPRFSDRDATNKENALHKAEQFLDRQELKSGLLVSRRSNSYRFVHLTFQEYLAAWNLAAQIPETVLEIIKPHLREQKWFETLQLLGGEWANRSDEFLNDYIEFLLQQQGKSIEQRAPVVALCANILRDVANTAEIQQATRERYNRALEDTLKVFDKGSKVPENTQLEILEALGKLGSAVKNHLINATKSSLRAVRSRAVEMLVPHLPDDDLFNMQHLLEDRSQLTINVYLSNLVERDVQRTMNLLLIKDNLNVKVELAILACAPRLADFFNINDLIKNDANSIRHNACKVLAENKKYTFYNKTNKDSAKLYESKTINNDKVVIDHASGLMWQQAGSNRSMVYYDVDNWIKELNKKGYAGYNDWRLPSLEEAIGLIEPTKKHGLYIDQVFNKKQVWIWTSDIVHGESRAWVVYFSYGECYRLILSSVFYVRAVRSGQSSG